MRDNSTLAYWFRTKSYLDEFRPMWKFVKENRIEIAEFLKKYDGVVFTRELSEYYEGLRWRGEHYDDKTIELALIIILFTSIALESHINDYGARRFSSETFQTLDKLSTVDKWLTFPVLINKEKIDTSDNRFRLFKELFTRRNAIVHPKTSFGAEDSEKRQEREDTTREFVCKCDDILEFMACEAKRVDPLDEEFGKLIPQLF